MPFSSLFARQVGERPQTAGAKPFRGKHRREVRMHDAPRKGAGYRRVTNGKAGNGNQAKAENQTADEPNRIGVPRAKARGASQNIPEQAPRLQENRTKFDRQGATQNAYWNPE